MFGDDNKQATGNVGNDSTVNQAGGDIKIYNSGLKPADVVPIVQALVHSELELYQNKAEETAKQRFSEFAVELERELTEKVADKIERFNDPAMQFATREAALGYIKTGDSLNRDSLIDMLIERTKLKENTTEQLLIDEAIKIIPKLSRESLAVLTLLTYTFLRLSGNRQVIDGWFSGVSDILNILPTVKPLDVASLLQVDCVSSLEGLVDKNRWMNSLSENYDAYFRKDISPENAKPFMDKYGIIVNDGIIIKNIPQDVNKLIAIVQMFQFNDDGSIRLLGSSKQWYKETLEKVGLGSMVEDVRVMIDSGSLFTQNEIMQHMSLTNNGWPLAFSMLQKAPLSGYSLKPVGAYIGTRQLSKIYKRDISIDLFYHS